MLEPGGPVGAANRLILINSLGIMLAIVIPTILATLGFAWWFRASNTRATYQPTFVHSGRVELIVWSIPLMTILLLGGIAWVGSHALDPAKPLDGGPPLEVQVVSLDWKWLFIYPDQRVASLNEVVVPAATPVHFSLTSSAVFNSFFVPSLGSMIYAMNAMRTQLHLKADAPGEYRGLSTHYSGDGFSDMKFVLRAVTPADFDAWVEKAKSTGSALDEQAYRDLSRQSSNVPPSTYRDVAPGLFDGILMQTLPPGPGPEAGRPSPDVTPKQDN